MCLHSSNINHYTREKKTLTPDFLLLWMIICFHNFHAPTFGEIVWYFNSSSKDVYPGFLDITDAFLTFQQTVCSSQCGQERQC